MAKIVGTGAVRVFPVMTGFKKTVKNEMAGSGREGAKGFADSLKGAGTKAGKQLGKELGTSIHIAVWIRCRTKTPKFMRSNCG